SFAGSVSDGVVMRAPSTKIAARDDLDLAREAAVDGVVPQQVGKHLRLGDIVDRDPLDVGRMLMGRAERRAPGAPETIDSNATSHNRLLSNFSSKLRREAAPAIGGSTAPLAGNP